MYADLKNQKFGKNIELEGKIDYFYTPYNDDNLKQYYMRFDDDENSCLYPLDFDDKDDNYVAKIKTTQIWRKISNFILNEDSEEYQ